MPVVPGVCVGWCMLFDHYLRLRKEENQFLYLYLIWVFVFWGFFCSFFFLVGWLDGLGVLCVCGFFV